MGISSTVTPEKLDDFDRRILRVLQEDADIPMAEIAERVGLSHTPCWRRIKRLEAVGILKRRVALVDARKCGLMVQVLASVTLKEHSEDVMEAFEKAATALPEVMECHIMSGSSDYMLRVVMPDVEAYEDFLKHHLLHLPGVSSVNSAFILRSIKQTTSLPL